MELQKLSSRISATAVKDQDRLTRKELLDKVAHYFVEDEVFLFTGYVVKGLFKTILFLTKNQVILFSEPQGKYLEKLSTTAIDKIEIKHAYSECYTIVNKRKSIQFKLVDKETIEKLNIKLKAHFNNLVTEKQSLGKKVINKSIKYFFIFMTFMLVVGIIIGAIEKTFNIQIIERSHYEETPVQSSKARIPGLLPGDVYIHYTKRGFNKSGPRKIADDVYSPNAGKYYWYLSKMDDSNYCAYDVNIYGPDGWSMDSIVASIVCPNPNDLMLAAANFFPFVVSLDYRGSNITSAVVWVRNSLGQKYTETTIGDIKFELKQDTAKSIYLNIIAE